jgi:hypothetical protein
MGISVFGGGHCHNKKDAEKEGSPFPSIPISPAAIPPSHMP